MNITFIAPPAAGKGALSNMIYEKYGYPHVSIGDLLRNVEDEKIKKELEAGAFVNNEIVAKLLYNRLSKDDCKNGFILDGFPRSLEQAEALNGIFERTGKFNLKNDAMAIYFDIDNEVLIQRLINRRSCPKCGTIYNLISNPPKIIDYCDICDSKLTIRKDDNEETARARFETYEKETAPLYDYFKQQGILKEIDAQGSISEIWEKVKQVVFEQ